jgi:hypothetical protein
MAAGDTSVQIVAKPITTATIKTALDAAITATSVGARVTVSTVDTDTVFITAIEV